MSRNRLWILTACVLLVVTTRSAIGGVWAEEARVLGTESEDADFFGWSVGVSGDRVIVGTHQPFRTFGTAYIFARSDNGTPSDPGDDSWPLEIKLVVSDQPPNIGFGFSVSIHGDWAFVGAPQDNDACPFENSCHSGAVYVFRLSDNGTPSDPGDDVWVEHAKLFASDPARLDNFGAPVSTGDEWAIVGASGDDDACPSDEFCNSGAAYFFRRDDNGTPSDTTDDLWIEQAKLTASDGEAGDVLGGAVSISGNMVVVGARLDDDACPGDAECNSGSVYVFRRDDNGTPSDPTDDLGVEQAKLTAPDAEAGDKFGQTVSIAGRLIVVGASRDDDACPTDPDCDSGSAYVFRLDENGTTSFAGDDFWVMEAKLAPDEPIPGDLFGFSVSMDLVDGVHRAVITSNPVAGGSGTPGDPNPPRGSAYIFRLNNNGTPLDPGDDSWFLEAKLPAPDSAKREAFGTGVAIDGRRAVVGAIFGRDLPEDEGSIAGGAAYVFALDCPPVPTVTAWGILVMFLLVLTGGTIALE